MNDDMNASHAGSINQRLFEQMIRSNARPARARAPISRAARQLRKSSSGGNKTVTSNIVHFATSTPSSNSGSGPRCTGTHT